MPTNNALNNSLANCTGLPIAGIAASGTPSSSTYLRGDGAWQNAPTITSSSFTPAVTFATPGDLSVVYTTQLGWYYRMGNMVFIEINLDFTPTYTTSSGLFRITGLPFTVGSQTANTQWNCTVLPTIAEGYGLDCTWMGGWFEVGNTTIRLQGMGPKFPTLDFSVADGQIPTGKQHNFFISGHYQV